MKTNYVAGFMFNDSLTEVALIRKKKPAWQRGKLNGIGGKVEKGEFAFTAMVREFEEETGAKTDAKQWAQFAEMTGVNDDGSEFHVDFFTTTGAVYDLRTMEEEKIEVVLLSDLYPTRPDVLDNLIWLIALAVDHLQDGRPSFATVEYTTGGSAS